MSYVGFFVIGSSCSGSLSCLGRTSVSERDPIANENLLGSGGLETKKRDHTIGQLR